MGLFTLFTFSEKNAYSLFVSNWNTPLSPKWARLGIRADHWKALSIPLLHGVNRVMDFTVNVKMSAILRLTVDFPPLWLKEKRFTVNFFVTISKIFWPFNCKWWKLSRLPYINGNNRQNTTNQTIFFCLFVFFLIAGFKYQAVSQISCFPRHKNVIYGFTQSY